MDSANIFFFIRFQGHQPQFLIFMSSTCLELKCLFDRTQALFNTYHVLRSYIEKIEAMLKVVEKEIIITYHIWGSG